MNANELADELDDIDAYEKHQTLLGKSAETLRQQQAEIADKKLVNDTFADLIKKQGKKIEEQQIEIEALKANRKHDFGLGEASGFIKGHKENPYKAITNTKIEPTVVSYTHPVKELTDEEKTELENALKVCEYKYFGSYPLSEKQWEAFELLEKHAKAILRKAQEK